tara:strand:- start:644 stop:961 length:318 start_codon:yes stop_codon:yes gene_type:complete
MRNILRRRFHWVYGKTSMGKPIVMGPYSEHVKATAISEKLEEGQIFTLNTRNMQQATRTIKAQLVQASGNVDEHIQRHGHAVEGQRAPFENPKSSLASQILGSSD